MSGASSENPPLPGASRKPPRATALFSLPATSIRRKGESILRGGPRTETREPEPEAAATAKECSAALGAEPGKAGFDWKPD